MWSANLYLNCISKLFLSWSSTVHSVQCMAELSFTCLSLSTTFNKNQTSLIKKDTFFYYIKSVISSIYLLLCGKRGLGVKRQKIPKKTVMHIPFFATPPLNWTNFSYSHSTKRGTRKI